MKKSKCQEDRRNQETADLLQGLDLIAEEIGKHEKEDSFTMDCPFCGAAGCFEMIKTVYSAAGRCSACEVPVHIRFDMTIH